ncbi:MAG TPA: hypothetical protein VI894_03165 [Candidatus Nanoarchaeia archaeon]|nr:hypothetical protein [Candidatus Nanoarchaeia archaeon]
MVEKKTVNLILNIFLVAVVALAAFSIVRSLTSRMSLSTEGLTGLVIGEKPVKVIIQFNKEITNDDIDLIEKNGKIEKIDYAGKIITASIAPSQISDIQLSANVKQVIVQK